MSMNNNISFGNRSGMMVLLNVLKHYFIDKCLHNMIKIYRKTVLTFLTNTTTTAPIGNEGPKVINDGDVNRIFGWAIMKVQK